MSEEEEFVQNTPHRPHCPRRVDLWRFQNIPDHPNRPLVAGRGGVMDRCLLFKMSVGVGLP